MTTTIREGFFRTNFRTDDRLSGTVNLKTPAPNWVPF